MTIDINTKIETDNQEIIKILELDKNKNYQDLQSKISKTIDKKNNLRLKIKELDLLLKSYESELNILKISIYEKQILKNFKSQNEKS